MKKVRALKSRRRYRLPSLEPIQYDYASSVSLDATGLHDARSLAKLSSGNLSHAGECTIGMLAQRANAGDVEAAWGLARAAAQATRELTRIAEARPELLALFARERHAWPVMKSRREALSQKEKAMFSKLQLGKDALMELDPATSKWKMDPGGRIALSLLTFIERGRRRLNSKTLAKRMDYGKFANAINALPSFSEATAKAWWDLAEQILLSSYPHPGDVAELNRLVTAPSKRKSPGRIRVRILTLLRSRFLSFPRNDY